MDSPLNAQLLSRRPQVVATIHTPYGLRLARKLRASDVDFLELRVDAWAERQELLLKQDSVLRLPLIITVRDFREGGVERITLRDRQSLFEKYLPFAAFFDVELRSISSFEKLIDRAREQGVKIIASHHDFKATPSVARLSVLVQQAKKAGADILKVATTTSTPIDLARMMAFVAGTQKIPVSAMGMGKYGKISRLALACAGSRLNYGFIDRPNAEGQWPAQLLKKRIDELMS